MNIEKKVIDEVSLQLTLSINEEDYKGRVDNALRSYRQKASIPGFRPGKAPASLIDKMYRKSAMAEEVNKMVPEMLSNYINENKLRVLGEPILAEGQELLDFEKDVNYTLTFDVALIPEYKVALDKNIKVAQYEITVDDKMIDDTIKSYASRYGSYSEGEEVKENDIVKATVVELENGKEKEGGVRVEEAILSPKYLKDENQKKLFIGAKKGAKLNISLKAAMDGNEAEIASFLKIKKEDVANVNDELSLEITSISHYTEAEVNQELFDKALGEGAVKNEAEFRAKIKEELKDSKLSVNLSYSRTIYPDERFSVSVDLVGDASHQDVKAFRKVLRKVLRWESYKEEQKQPRMLPKKCLQTGCLSTRFPSIQTCQLKRSKH